MSDQKCDVCEEDPGPGDACQNCGSRQYRYATDDLYAESDSPSAATDQDDAVARALRKRLEDMENIGAAERRASVDDTAGAWSMAQQAEAIDNLEHPTTGALPAESKSGRGCLAVFLLVFAVGAIIVVGGIFAIARNADSLEDFFDDITTQVSVSTEAIVDTSPFIEQVDLENWSDAAVGDCFNEDRDEFGIYPPIVVDCRSSHDGEFSFIGNLPQDNWPGTEEASSTANALCIDAFPGYIGSEYSESVWYSNGLYPSEEQWASGDKTFHCYVYLPDTTASEPAGGSHK